MNSKKEYIEKNLHIISDMIEKNRPKAEICRMLQVKPETLDKYLKIFGIKYNGNMSRKGLERNSKNNVIFKYLENEKTVSASRLRKLLINSGLKEEKCENCGLSEWMGKKIPLELHHINFNHYDNTLENLQILCSNCHGIVHDYSNVKIQEKKVKNQRNKSLSPTVREKEYHTRQRKCDRPTKEELFKLILTTSFVKIGKMYGVSDKTISKWCKNYGLPFTRKQIKNIEH